MKAEFAEGPLGTHAAFPQPAEDLGVKQGQDSFVIQGLEAFQAGTSSFSPGTDPRWLCQRKEAALKILKGNMLKAE